MELNNAFLSIIFCLVQSGAIISEGDRKRVPFLVLGLSLWYGTIFLFLEQIAPLRAAHVHTCCVDFCEGTWGKWCSKSPKCLIFLVHNSVSLCLLEFCLRIFVVSCSNLSEVRPCRIYSYVPLYITNQVGFPLLTRTPHYSTLNFTYNED